MSLAGKLVLITGSTRGIGLATARAVGTQGGRVVLHGRNVELLGQRADELRAEGIDVAGHLAFDVHDQKQTSAAFARMFSEHKRLDGFVANAGVLGDALIGMISEELLHNTIGVNLVAVISQVQLAARIMQRSGGGSIVLVSSIIGTNGNRGQIVYSATKSAVLGIVRSAAKELGGKGIRVNSVAPGFIETDMVAHLASDVRQERLAGIALQRAGQPFEVASAIAFLLSDAASYVTGQNLGVDGCMVI